MSENVALATWVAGRYAPLATDKDEVFLVARMGLLEAAERFDPERGTFATLAVLCCRHAIFNELKRQRRTYLEVPVFVVDEDGKERVRADLPAVPPPDVETPLMLSRLRDALADLPSLERRVLELRWGLTGEECSFQEIGAAMGLPAYRARTLEGKARARLHRHLTGKKRLRDLTPWSRPTNTGGTPPRRLGSSRRLRSSRQVM